MPDAAPRPVKRTIRPNTAFPPQVDHPGGGGVGGGEAYVYIYIYMYVCVYV